MSHESISIEIDTQEILKQLPFKKVMAFVVEIVGELKVNDFSTKSIYETILMRGEGSRALKEMAECIPELSALKLIANKDFHLDYEDSLDSLVGIEDLLKVLFGVESRVKSLKEMVSNKLKEEKESITTTEITCSKGGIPVKGLSGVIHYRPLADRAVICGSDKRAWKGGISSTKEAQNITCRACLSVMTKKVLSSM